MSSRLLFTRDIVECILDEINDRRSLLSIGLASRVLLGLALDRIWVDAPLLYVAKLMPAHVWTLRADNIRGQKIEMRELARNEDWIGQRLPLYSRRVRRLCWPGDRWDNEHNRVLGNSLCMTWATHLMRAPLSLFPNLRQFYIDVGTLTSKPQITLLSALLPRRLESLSLTISEQDGGRGCVEFLEHLASPEQALQLDSISISWYKVERPFDEAHNACVPHLREVIRKGTLKKLNITHDRISTFVPTPPTPYLFYLTELEAKITSQDTQWAKGSPEQLLPLLEVARLSGEPGNIIQFVSCITSKRMSHLEIEFSVIGRLASEYLVALAQALVEHPSHDVLRAVRIRVNSDTNLPRNTECGSAEFQHFFIALTNLRLLHRLELPDSIIFRPDIRTIMRFASMGSSLHRGHNHIAFPLVPFHAYIRVYFPFRHWDAVPFALDLGDPNILAPQQHKRSQFTEFRYLYVGGNPKLEDVPALADVIIEIFPSLTQISYFSLPRYVHRPTGPMTTLLEDVSCRITHRGSNYGLDIPT